MTDHPLIAFLRARLDEDERIARDADGISRDTLLDLYEDLIKSRPLDDQRRAYGIHISHFTSGRILWDITAKRRLIEQHPLVEAGTYGQSLAGDNSQPFGCQNCHDWDGVVVGGGYCDTLKLLALPYADHEDYREEWRL